MVHLGDYIYEGPGSSGLPERLHAPRAELLSLNDYRTRLAQYKLDPDLQAAHAAFPWLMTWDDHELKNNYANLDFDPNQPIEEVAARRAAAYLAYWEHAPLARSRKPIGPDMNLYRSLQLGVARALSRARHAPVPRRPDADAVRPGRARPAIVLLPGAARSGAFDPRRRAAQLAVRRAGGDAGERLERPRQPGRLRRAGLSAGARPTRLLRGQLGRLRRRPPARARLPREAQAQERGRDHGRQAPELRPQRRRALRRPCRVADRDRVRGHLDQQRRRHAGPDVVRRRPAQPAHPVRELQPRLRPGGSRPRQLADRLPRRGDGHAARERRGVDARELDRRERKPGAIPASGAPAV